MKNVLFHHSYLTEDLGTWSSILMEQMTLLETTDLLRHIELAKFTVIGRKEQVEIFVDICNQFFENNIEFEFIENIFESDQKMLSTVSSQNVHYDMMSENYTMTKIKEYSKSNSHTNVLYMHLKGVTSTERFLRTKNSFNAKVYYYWRRYIQWGAINNWKLCIDALKIYDVAGCNFFPSPSPHFSGSFWWAKSGHIERLPDIRTSEWFSELKESSPDSEFKQWAGDRMKAEMWPCSHKDTKVFSVHSPPINMAYIRPYYPFEYEGKQNSLDMF